MPHLILVLIHEAFGDGGNLERNKITQDLINVFDERTKPGIPSLKTESLGVTTTTNLNKTSLINRQLSRLKIKLRFYFKLVLRQLLLHWNVSCST